MSRKRSKNELAKPVAQLVEQAQELIEEGVPENTRRTYQAQWSKFVEWCRAHDQIFLPASGETLVLYFTHLSNSSKVSTIAVAMSAINAAHREAGYSEWHAGDQPGVRILLRGIRRTKAEPKTKKKALLIDDILKLVKSAEASPMLVAMILVGFFGAMRRSEILHIRWDSVQFVTNGMRITLWGSKTDKSNVGQDVFIPSLDTDYCPVKALQALPKKHPIWVFPSNVANSQKPISDFWFVSQLKQHAQKIGIDPSLVAGHSLRSGFVTQAIESGAEERDIMRVTRHRSVTTLREYIQESEAAKNHPGQKIVNTIKKE